MPGRTGDGRLSCLTSICTSGLDGCPVAVLRFYSWMESGHEKLCIWGLSRYSTAKSRYVRSIVLIELFYLSSLLGFPQMRGRAGLQEASVQGMDEDCAHICYLDQSF